MALKPAAELGDTVTLLGERLTREDTILRLEHPNLTNALEDVRDEREEIQQRLEELLSAQLQAVLRLPLQIAH